MEILKVDPKNPDQEIIKRAVDVLTDGGLVIYPTDTAYGLAANALNEAAVKRVYEVKGRNLSKPTHVVVADWRMIEKLTFTNSYARALFEKFLPGPLTIILPKKKIVPDILTAKHPTLGVRIPHNLITQSISLLINFPYTTPSANKEGGGVPYSVEDLRNKLDLEKIDLILDAEKLPSVLPSTIIDLSTSPPKLLRQGPINKLELEKTLTINLTI